MKLDAATLLLALQGQLPEPEVARLSSELAEQPAGSVWMLAAQAGIHITGDGNIVGNHNLSIVVKGQGSESLAAVLRESLERGRSLHQLRAPVADFVGREGQIEELVSVMRGGGEGPSRIGGISGLGGVGKSELALKVAHALRADYPDAQLFLNLRGTSDQSRDLSDALATCIRAFLGTSAVLPTSEEELGALYRDQLSGQRALIVLDNAADSHQVLPLRPPDGCALLVTSRSVITLPGMRRLLLEQLAPQEARTLLQSIAPRISVEMADQIAALCGYLPLALRAAGSLLDVTADLKPADYVVRLANERTRLEQLGVEGVDLGVEASFTLSYDLLKPDAQEVFARLSVFPASFDAQAAEIVCEDAGHAHLSELLKRSLVQHDSATERYRLHDLARLFAARRDEGEQAISRQRHAVHYQAVLAQADALYLQGGEAMLRGLQLFDTERANIEAGQSWASAYNGRQEEATQLCLAYPDVGVCVLSLRQLPHQRLAWLQVSLAAAHHLKDRRGEGTVLGNLGLAYRNLGELRRAIAFSEQASVIAREIGDRRGEGNALMTLGIAYTMLSGTRRAIEFFEQSLAIAREIGDRQGEGTVLSNLGLAYGSLGEPRRAIEFFEQDLRIAREIGDRDEVTVLGNLGNAYTMLDEPGRAIEFYEQALILARETGDRHSEGAMLSNLGIAFINLGETQRAIECYEQSLVIAREIGDRHSEGNALGNLSNVYEALGNRAQAIAYMEVALEIFEQIKAPYSTQARELLVRLRGETNP